MNIEQILIDKGYRKYKDYGGSFPHSSYFYQKKFKDDKGAKYFIEFIFYLKNGPLETSVMCNLSIDNPHQTYEQHHVKDVDLAESNCEKFFLAMNCEYNEYER